VKPCVVRVEGLCMANCHWRGCRSKLIIFGDFRLFFVCVSDDGCEAFYLALNDCMLGVAVWVTFAFLARLLIL
jgi:hypothetical protein